jgi:uncharacterized membrane protein
MADTTEEPAWALGLGRIAGLSDAVFAFALTLLVIEIAVPVIPSSRAAADLPQKLLDLAPKWSSYVIGFTVIALYWAAHHRVFTFIRRYDNVLITLNFALLFTIAVQPFTTGLVGEYGNTTLAVSLYALLLGLTGLILFGIWAYATGGHRLVDRHIDQRLVRHHSVRALVISGVFLVSIAVAFVRPLATPVFWVVVSAAAFWITNRIYGRRSHPTPRRRGRD